MTTDRTAVRSDLDFLRRRQRAVDAVAPAPPPPPPPTTTPPPATTRPPSARAEPSGSRGLSLGGPAHPEPANRKSRRPVAPAPFAAPGPTDVRELDAETPLVRLDRRRSAIGSLVVTGPTMLAWESVDGVTGSATKSGERQGAEVVTAGNRPLVGFDEGLALVSLRHVRSLRRALMVGRGVDGLGVRLFDGTTLSVPTPTPGGLVALSLLVVDGELELRAEPVEAGLDDPTVHREFGFSMTHRFAFPTDSP